MRWMRAAGRALLVGAVVLAGYTGLGVRAGAGTGPEGRDRGPLTLVTAGDLTNYLLRSWRTGTTPIPTSASRSSNCPTRRTRPGPR